MSALVKYWRVVLAIILVMAAIPVFFIGYLSGHHDVGEDEIEAGFVHSVVGFGRARTAPGLKAVFAQKRTDHLIQLPIILHQKDLKHELALPHLSALSQTAPH